MIKIKSTDATGGIKALSATIQDQNQIVTNDASTKMMPTDLDTKKTTGDAESGQWGSPTSHHRCGCSAQPKYPTGMEEHAAGQATPKFTKSPYTKRVSSTAQGPLWGARDHSVGGVHQSCRFQKIWKFGRGSATNWASRSRGRRRKLVFNGGWLRPPASYFVSAEPWVRFV